MVSKKFRVGITMRSTNAMGYEETRDSIASDWANFLHVAIAGAAWLYVPNLGGPRSVDYCEKLDVTALIFSGGEDLGVYPHRDETERALLEWASKREHPAIGICRGMQLMAIESGAALSNIDGHVATRHAITGSITRDVNSYHKMGFTECPSDYCVLAEAEGGTIEAIGHRSLPWEGWMWHPEREKYINPSDVHRMRKVFKLS